MISKAKCRHLGTLAKPHGTKGALMLKLRNNKAEDFKKRESVFVEIDGLLVPFFVETIKDVSSENIILKLDEIDSESAAKKLAGSELYVNTDQIRRKRKSPGNLPDFAGYKVTDHQLGFVGIAGGIEDISNNPLLNVSHEGRNIMIPLHEDIIVSIDDNEQLIIINAPEGLLDL